MRAKSFLFKLKILDTKIKNMQGLLEELESGSVIDGVDYSRERIEGTIVAYSHGALKVHKAEELKENIRKEIAKYYKIKYEIIEAINSLENSLFIEILYKRYVEYKSFEDIALDLELSLSYIKHQHGFALLDLDKIISNKRLNCTKKNAKKH